MPTRTKPRRRDHPVTTYLRPDDLERLDALAARRDQSRSGVARELLREALTASAKPDRRGS
jgi:hypothetical protein